MGTGPVAGYTNSSSIQKVNNHQSQSQPTYFDTLPHRRKALVFHPDLAVRIVCLFSRCFTDPSLVSISLKLEALSQPCLAAAVVARRSHQTQPHPFVLYSPG